MFYSLLQDRSKKVLISLVILCMGALTVASQLEIIALGVITDRGPDFFEVLSPIKNGKVARKKEISLEGAMDRLNQLAEIKENEQVLNSTSISLFLKEHGQSNLIEKFVQAIDAKIPLRSNFKILAFFLVFVALLKAVTLFGYRYTSRLVSIKISSHLRQSYFEHLQKLPLDFYQEHHMGSLSARVMGDASIIADALNSSLTNYLQTPFIIVSTLVLCFATSWQLSLIVFFGFPLLLYPILFLAKRVKKISKQIQKSQEQFSSVLIDFLGGIQTVKAFAMEDFSLKKYREHNSNMAFLEKKSARYDLSSRPIVHTIGMCFLAIALLYGLYVLEMNVSEVLVYCGFLYLFYEPIKKFAEENSRIQRGIAAIERLREVTELKPNLQDQENAIMLEGLKDKIEFDNVWFRYHNQWILKGISFTIEKGKTIAIVGPTGSGKSTIAQLLPRLYDVQKGEIRINGKTLSTYTQKSLREKIAFVPQKPFLFFDTISSNIAFGQPFSFEEIKTAASLAHADEFIRELPKGYHTELHETGKNLSGGQQQRLTIARALIKKAPILIMDEATSALDSLSEAQIKASLLSLKGQTTQIIIAHRLSTIENADKIIYLEKGEKIGEGSKEELMMNCPAFKKMWEIMHYQEAEASIK